MPVMLVVPEVEGVKVTPQLPADSVQLVALNEPVAPVDSNVTVLVGGICVPVLLVSVMVAVHFEGCPITTGLVQLRDVEEVRGFEVILNIVLLLASWVESLG